jgi:hypothetical protein
MPWTKEMKPWTAARLVEIVEELNSARYKPEKLNPGNLNREEGNALLEYINEQDRKLDNNEPLDEAIIRRALFKYARYLSTMVWYVERRIDSLQNDLDRSQTGDRTD